MSSVAMLRMARIDMDLEWKSFDVTLQEHFVEPAVPFSISKAKRRIYNLAHGVTSAFWLDHFNAYRRHFALSRSWI